MITDVVLAVLAYVAEGNWEERHCSGRGLTKQIDSFLDTLDKDNRVMFVRRYWYSDSISDIADRFHTNNHNITVCLSRIREKLKNHLKKEGYEI